MKSIIISGGGGGEADLSLSALGCLPRGNMFIRPALTERQQGGELAAVRRRAARASWDGGRNGRRPFAAEWPSRFSLSSSLARSLSLSFLHFFTPQTAFIYGEVILQPGRDADWILEQPRP